MNVTNTLRKSQHHGYTCIDEKWHDFETIAPNRRVMNHGFLRKRKMHRLLAKQVESYIKAHMVIITTRE